MNRNPDYFRYHVYNRLIYVIRKYPKSPNRKWHIFFIKWDKNRLFIRRLKQLKTHKN